ncbi:hypothetical protein DUI87_02686 [Hirundo rustica rustica]|uniref:Uncharacterized protein n=1 Tax=Hirundo rustica rustica TaxID=333673 RepID=A0A3M0L925_HIRRU|nr:hypothetical protein DUI87_02682 [Hirundo rustica rustica]RMC21817.1 hypothetical protein DUI87_02686 [Hirundo rustica rustica]
MQAVCAPLWYPPELPVGEDEARKPYKYDCLDSENVKSVNEIELKVLLTIEAAIPIKERGWINASRIKGPVDEPKEWTITSEPGDTKLTLKRGLGGNELGRPK